MMRDNGVMLTAIHLSDEGCWDETDWYSHFDNVFRNYVCPNDGMASADSGSRGGDDDDDDASTMRVRWFPLGIMPHIADGRPANRPFRLPQASLPSSSSSSSSSTPVVFSPPPPPSFDTAATRRRFWCNFLGQNKPELPERAALVAALPTRPIGKEVARWRAGWAALEESGDPSAFRCAVR